MSDPVSSIRNLGEASDAVYARAGIHTAEELHTLGPDEAYRRLLATGSRPHFIAYYAMVMGLQGRPWNDCQGKEKDALRKRFDALKAEATAKKPPEDKMEAILDEIGIRATQS
ncbi:TfoX/Sxy family DNA transformation protein [Aliiroseovarius sp. S253]|uniref:TfoX/Sxy family DNA transformation protein n=1 Tax=Aliiroseovarius sp. S253 TaxID=3415133 RepID=UPI003C7BF9E3